MWVTTVLTRSSSRRVAWLPRPPKRPIYPAINRSKTALPDSSSMQPRDISISETCRPHVNNVPPSLSLSLTLSLSCVNKAVLYRATAPYRATRICGTAVVMNATQQPWRKCLENVSSDSAPPFLSRLIVVTAASLHKLLLTEMFPLFLYTFIANSVVMMMMMMMRRGNASCVLGNLFQHER